jgi:sugar-specific transcriptional regulator TrmB
MSRYLKVLCEELIEEPSDGTMKKEEILRTLTSCGLNEYESRTYSSLVFLGTAKASKISKDSNVPQSKIYDVLDQLMKKQMVEMFDGRPKEFKAVEPEIALKRLIEKRDRELEALKTKVDTIAGFLKPFSKDETLNGIWTIKGKKWVEFFDKVVEMADRSKKYVYGVTRDYSRSAKLAESIKKCTKRGIKVRVIGLEDVTGSNYYKAKWYHEQGAKLRVFETKVHPRIALIDGNEVLLRLDYDPTKKNNFKFSAVWSEDPSLVRVFDAYVKNLWKSAKKVDLRKIPQPN